MDVEVILENSEREIKQDEEEEEEEDFILPKSDWIN